MRALAAAEQTDFPTVIAQLVAQAQQRSTVGYDPIFDLIGAYRSAEPLIDGIPVSEYPDLYAAAEELGVQAAHVHAWDIAPARYTRG